MIDPRAIVDPSAQIADGVTIGPWTTVGANVTIAEGCNIASHVVIRGPTTIAANVRIFQFATVGEDTPALAFHGEETSLHIGEGTIIREGVTLHRGMANGIGKTIVGAHCLLMAYVHVGHDCIVGDHVIMANNASISGHVEVGDYANFGGYSGAAQFRKIGAFTHIAAMSLVLKDIPAYMTVAGNPATAVGLNLEGMRRRGYDKATIKALRDAHKVVYREGNLVSEALAKLAGPRAQCPQVEIFAASIEAADRGIVRPRGTRDD